MACRGVFFEDFPNRVIYVRDLPATGGWRDVFLADSGRPDRTTAYFAREGRIIVDLSQPTQPTQATVSTTVPAAP